MYITREIPSVFLDRMVLITCGKKEVVVKNAAQYPKILEIFKIIELTL
ncbi:hypothetical protein GAMM_10099 [Gammaproteobacteria bacterium]